MANTIIMLPVPWGCGHQRMWHPDLDSAAVCSVPTPHHLNTHKHTHTHTHTHTQCYHSFSIDWYHFWHVYMFHFHLYYMHFTSSTIPLQTWHTIIIVWKKNVSEWTHNSSILDKHLSSNWNSQWTVSKAGATALHWTYLIRACLSSLLQLPWVGHGDSPLHWSILWPLPLSNLVFTDGRQHKTETWSHWVCTAIWPTMAWVTGWWM